MNEVNIASNNQPLSVLLLDVGAIIKNKNNPDPTTEISKGIFEISNSNLIDESMMPGENTKKLNEKKVEGSVDVQNLSVKNMDIYWGIGNRAAMFILARKVADSIEAEKMKGNKNKQLGKESTSFSCDELSPNENKEIINTDKNNDSKNNSEIDSKNNSEIDSKNNSEIDSKNNSEIDSKNNSEIDSKNNSEIDSKNNSEIDSNSHNTNFISIRNSHTHNLNSSSVNLIIDNNIDKCTTIQTETISSSESIQAETLDLLNAKDASAKILADSKVNNITVL